MRPPANLATLFVVALTTPLTAQEPAPTADLRGVVRGPGTGRTRVTVWHNDMDKRHVEPIAEGFTDADGAFAFARVPWCRRQQWGSNTMVVVARSTGHAGLCTLRGDDAPIAAIAIEVGPTVTVRGTLRGADERPLANASVWPAIFGNKPGGHQAAWVTQPLLPWQTTTKADGTFELRDLPPLAPFELRASHPDHAATWIPAPDAAQPVLATLALGGRLRGRVRMPDGSPAVRVPVYAQAAGTGFGTGTTDEHGVFELVALQGDHYQVWAEVPDLTVIAAHQIPVVPGETTDGVHVQLTPGGFIVGRVVDDATGRPFAPGPWTDVAMYGPARPAGGACECVPVHLDGTFRIRAPAGDNRIYLRGADGHVEPSDVVTVRDGKETTVEWRLVRKPAAK